MFGLTLFTLLFYVSQTGSSFELPTVPIVVTDLNTGSSSTSTGPPQPPRSLPKTLSHINFIDIEEPSSLSEGSESIHIKVTYSSALDLELEFDLLLNGDLFLLPTSTHSVEATTTTEHYDKWSKTKELNTTISVSLELPHKLTCEHHAILSVYALDKSKFSSIATAKDWKSALVAHQSVEYEIEPSPSSSLTSASANSVDGQDVMKKQTRQKMRVQHRIASAECTKKSSGGSKSTLPNSSNSSSSNSNSNSSSSSSNSNSNSNKQSSNNCSSNGSKPDAVIKLVIPRPAGLISRLATADSTKKSASSSSSSTSNVSSQSTEATDSSAVPDSLTMDEEGVYAEIDSDTVNDFGTDQDEINDADYFDGLDAEIDSPAMFMRTSVSYFNKDNWDQQQIEHQRNQRGGDVELENVVSGQEGEIQIVSENENVEQLPS